MISKGNHVKFARFVLLAVSEFQQFRIFWKLYQEISVPCVPVSKFSEFLAKLKVSLISKIFVQNNIWYSTDFRGMCHFKFLFFYFFFIWPAFFLFPCSSWSTCYGHWLRFTPWSGGACWLTLEHHRQSIFLLGWARFCIRLTSKSVSQVDKSH